MLRADILLTNTCPDTLAATSRFSHGIVDTVVAASSNNVTSDAKARSSSLTAGCVQSAVCVAGGSCQPHNQCSSNCTCHTLCRGQSTDTTAGKLTIVPKLARSDVFRRIQGG